jgi:hypothetical protein
MCMRSVRARKQGQEVWRGSEGTYGTVSVCLPRTRLLMLRCDNQWHCTVRRQSVADATGESGGRSEERESAAQRPTLHALSKHIAASQYSAAPPYDHTTHGAYRTAHTARRMPHGACPHGARRPTSGLPHPSVPTEPPAASEARSTCVSWGHLCLGSFMTGMLPVAGLGAWIHSSPPEGSLQKDPSRRIPVGAPLMT